MEAPDNVLRSLLVTLIVVGGLIVLSVWGSLYLAPAEWQEAEIELGSALPVSVPAGPPESTVTRIADLVAPSVAFLVIETASGVPIKNGSALVVRDDGYLVTNAHVVEGAERVRVVLEDGTSLLGEVYGFDQQTDVAVVKVGPDEPLAAAVLGDSDNLSVGEFVLALGAPFGLTGTVSVGIVSGLDRRGLGIARYERFIVTDAAINRGNSGGPLVNLAGEAVGINTAIIAGDERGSYSGVGFAIPMNVVERVAKRIIARRQRRENHSGEAHAHPLVSGDAGRSTAGAKSPGTWVGRVVVVGPAGEVVDHGSSVVLRRQGYLVTNAHVVQGGRDLVVQLPGWTPAAAKVVAVDAHTDLAVIQVELRDGPLVEAPLGVSRSLEAGEPVVAVGWQGENLRRSPGRVTALHVSGIGVSTYENFIETDAPIRRGHSGGPLLDGDERVVGINTAALTEGRGDNGSNAYAIPIEDVQWVVDALIRDGRVERAAAGFAGGTIDDARIVERFGLQQGIGCIVTFVQSDGAARRAGLLARDIIVEVDGEPLTDCQHWQKTELPRQQPGTRIELTVYREGERLSVELELAAATPPFR